MISRLTPLKAALVSASVVEEAIDMSFVTFQLTATDPKRTISEETDFLSVKSVASLESMNWESACGKSIFFWW